VDANSLAVGQTVIVPKLAFGIGQNDFLAPVPGAIFVTDLGPEISSGQLDQMGVFGDKQQFAVQFDEELAFHQGVRVYGVVPSRNIYAIPGGSVLVGAFPLIRRF
jgi:hypothetical protein